MLRHHLARIIKHKGSSTTPLRTLPLGAERLGSILNLSFVKLLKRGDAQQELMNPNRLDEAAEHHLGGGILFLNLSGTDRDDKETTVVVHIEKIVVV